MAKGTDAIYKQLVDLMNNMGLKFSTDDAEKEVEIMLRGDDLPYVLKIQVNGDKQSIDFFSPMPFEVSEEKRGVLAYAACIANYALPLGGAFDYNVKEGVMYFRMIQPYDDTDISDKLLARLLSGAAYYVDRYNDKFFLLSKGLIDLDEFVKFEETPQ